MQRCTSVRGQGRYGGMWGQKQKLLKGIHPRLGTSLPYPIYEDGTFVHSSGQYPNLPANRSSTSSRPDQAPLLGDVVGASKREITPSEGKTARQKMGEREERVREKERLAKLRSSDECGRSRKKDGVRRRTHREANGGGVGTHRWWCGGSRWRRLGMCFLRRTSLIVGTAPVF